MKVKLLLVLLFIINHYLFSQEKIEVAKSEFDKNKELAQKYLEIKGIDTLGYFTLKKVVTINSLAKENSIKGDVEFAEIEVKEGSIKDILIRVIVNDKKIDFRNKYPISLIKYNSYYYKWRLFSKDDYSISISEVLDYFYYSGKNYISDAKNITINPSKKEYLIVDYSLNALIDFRVYSDFLGLINETANGILSFEATSNIYINYANFYNTHFFKAIQPSLSYSRFDNDDRKIKLNNNTIQNSLDLVQKQFLNLGVSFNIFEFKHTKNAFYLAHIPLKFSYGLVEINQEDTQNSISTGVFNYGTGMHFDFKRLHNFGLKVGILFDRYRQKRDDLSQDIELLNFSTIGTNAEMYFYDNKNKNSAIFLRLKYKETISGVKNNFASIQFGYKTALNFSKK